MPPLHVPLGEIPPACNGKADREALPDPTKPTAASRRPPGSGRPPGGRREAAVASVWRAGPGRDGIGLDDTFFDAGGTSLPRVEAVTRPNAELGTRPTSLGMFRNPRARTTAARLTAPPHANGPPAEPVPDAAVGTARRIDRPPLRPRRRRA